MSLNCYGSSYSSFWFNILSSFRSRATVSLPSSRRTGICPKIYPYLLGYTRRSSDRRVSPGISLYFMIMDAQLFRGRSSFEALPISYIHKGWLLHDSRPAPVVSTSPATLMGSWTHRLSPAAHYDCHCRNAIITWSRDHRIAGFDETQGGVEGYPGRCSRICGAAIYYTRRRGSNAMTGGVEDGHYID
jgi:hypothetical protein